MALKADDMATAIENQMAQAWQDVKNSALPASDPNDRRVMFLAISRGVISYLQTNLQTPAAGATEVGSIVLTAPSTAPAPGAQATYTLNSLALDATS